MSLTSRDSSSQSIIIKHKKPLSFESYTYDAVLDAVGNAQMVLIGDGSHGTYEFYAHRANITRRLIEEKEFKVVAVEADWPDAYRINRYIHGDPKVENSRDALAEFERFPKWMWKNEVMPPFIDYLKARNDEIVSSTGDLTQQISFYGLDLYSLHRSAEAVIEYLEKIDPEEAKKARKRYNCFERFGEDVQQYAYATQFGLAKSCESEVVEILQRLIRKHHHLIHAGSLHGSDINSPSALHPHPAEEQFMAEVNALVVRDSEEYYRTMLDRDVESWNLRDEHFVRTLQLIADHLRNKGQPPKIVVWAHNSHIGDARATDMGRRRGEINVGQRCREVFGEDNVFNLGFLTDRGTVTAAPEWDSTPHLYEINPPLPGSLEELFDEASEDDFLLVTRQILRDRTDRNRKAETDQDLTKILDYPARLQRFIGVIYRPQTERYSHYSKCSAAKQYDAIAFLKHSRGIMPLEKERTWKGLHKDELDPTFPFAV